LVWVQDGCGVAFGKRCKAEVVASGSDAVFIHFVVVDAMVIPLMKLQACTQYEHQEAGWGGGGLDSYPSMQNGTLGQVA
jgi:hypothetical protein